MMFFFKISVFVAAVVADVVSTGEAYDYKTLYIEQPLIAIWKNGEIPFFKETEFLVRKNIAWRDRKDDRKVKIVQKMINIEKVVPLTPHGAFQLGCII